MHKTDSEMQKAAAFVRYEWRQFSWAASEIPRALAGEDSRPGTGGPEPSEDAVFEVLLLHARALRDFFGRRRGELRRFEQTDIVAEDFFDRPDECPTPTFGYLAGEHDRLNRALAHLSYDRSIYELNGKDWDFDAIIAELATAKDSFLAALPTDRRYWFT